ncbi:MAG: FAD-dependent oxidoreductase [Bacteroidota bacterium]
MNGRIVVIGGLAAGPAAAAKAKRTAPNAEVLLIEGGEHISYGICEIPYYVGGTVRIAEDLLVYTPERFEKEKGVKVRTLHHAEKIHAAARVIEVRDFQTGRIQEVRYDRLILATGSRPRKLGLEGEKARNVFAIKSFQEAKALRKFLETENPKKAVVIGGGYIGMEMAESFTARAMHVTVLHRWEQPMWGLEKTTREAVAAELTGNGVSFVPGARVQSIGTTKDSTASSVRTESSSFEADVIVVCTGVEPNTELALESGIRLGDERGILTDQRQVTSIDGIYAAGDCCEVKNLVNNKLMYCPLATIAARQGRVAGHNAAGGSSVFKGALRAIAVKVFSMEVARVGLSSAEAEESGLDPVLTEIEANSRVPLFPGNERIHIITIVDRSTRRLLGANVFGRDGAVLRANTLSLAIQNRMTLDEFSDSDLIYSPPFTPLWDPLLIVGHQFRKSMDHEKPHHHRPPSRKTGSHDSP